MSQTQEGMVIKFDKHHNLQSVLQLKQLRAGGRGMGGVTFMNDLWQINFEFEKFPSINTQNMKK
jgi:hypothetical protein